MALFLNRLEKLRKLSIILLIFLHLIANTDFIEVFSVAKLVTHYKQHKKTTQNLSFVEFLHMHYTGDDGTTTDDNEDKKLPFHNPNIHSLTTVLLDLPQINNIEKPLEYCFDGILLGNRFKTYIQKNCIPTLLHPPRFNA